MKIKVKMVEKREDRQRQKNEWERGEIRGERLRILTGSSGCWEHRGGKMELVL